MTLRYKAIDHLSASQIIDFNRCSAYYLLKHILRYPEKQNVARMVGKAFHSVLKSNFLFKASRGRDYQEQTLVEKFGEKLNKDIIKIQSSFSVKQQLKIKALENGVQALRSYRRQFLPNLIPLKDKDGAWVERKAFIRFSNVPWTVEVVLDLVTEDEYIVDFKTGHNAKSRSDFEGDLQLATYLWFYRYHFKRNPKGIWVDDLVYNPKGATAFRIDIDMGRLYIDQLPDIYARIRGSIIRNLFHPRRNNWVCRYCDFWNPCEGGAWIM